MKKVPRKFGLAFGDLIEKSKARKSVLGTDLLKEAENWGKGSQKEPVSFTFSPWRMMIVYVFMAVLVLIIMTRSFDLQIIKGQEFLNQAEGNRIQLVVNHAPRGVIYDRDGVILAQNIPSARLVYDPLVEINKEKLIQKLSEIIEIDQADLRGKLDTGADKPITLVDRLLIDKIPQFEAEESNLPGITLEIRPIRNYPHGEALAHVIGYTLEADEADIAKNIAVPHSLGDQVGKAGVEASRESILRGVNGYKLVSISASGEKTGEVFQSNFIEGQDITLSIDLKLQKYVHDLLNSELKKLGGRRGSAVVMDPATGELLAMISIPSYNNNLFVKGIDTATYNRLISNSNKPLLNRSIGSSYPPGSTFKLVTSAAGLETGTITPGTRINDPGFINLGGQIFRNWLWLESQKTEGDINVVRALARSTDTFYYRLGQMMGEETIQNYARNFGLGSLTGIQLPEEISGLVPDNEWKLATKGEPWYPGETLNLSIGQGDLLTTPLQVAVFTSVFANHGKHLKPTILKTDQGEFVKENFLKSETIDTVREGMYQNTVGDGGVSWLFTDSKYKSAGKTGTAESGQESPHAWYTAFMPYENPEIVVTVMVEHSGHGSEVSAPITKKIFDWWFENKDN